ncbi:protein CEI [Piliocolobus tephrosceles]|uniref:protein CEI n=1 Tax=Piliocolobus tephrosceles TaxID=591936 RepID=UPI001301247B|nr:protein CEI [Piliocolobus tephrosceles]
MVGAGSGPSPRLADLSPARPRCVPRRSPLPLPPTRSHIHCPAPAGSHHSRPPSSPPPVPRPFQPLPRPPPPSPPSRTRQRPPAVRPGRVHLGGSRSALLCTPRRPGPCVQSGSRREVGRSGWWRRGSGPPPGSARGSHFHGPGPALPPGPRLPAWPRVWSPTPRGPLLAAWTWIRGALVANCQEGPEPRNLERVHVDMQVSASGDFLRGRARGLAGLGGSGSGSGSPRELGRPRRPGRSPGSAQSSVSRGRRSRRRPGVVRAGGEGALWPASAGLSPGNGGRDPPPPTAA